MPTQTRSPIDPMLDPQVAKAIVENAAEGIVIAGGAMPGVAPVPVGAVSGPWLPRPTTPAVVAVTGATAAVAALAAAPAADPDNSDLHLAAVPLQEAGF